MKWLRPSFIAAVLMVAVLVSSGCANWDNDPTVHEASALSVPTPTPDARAIPFGFRGGRQGH